MKWAFIFIISSMVVLCSNGQYKRLNFDQDIARKLAISRFYAVCEKECSAQGFHISSFNGPIDVPITFDRKNKHFEFYWKNSDGEDFYIFITDNGLFIDEYWWWEEVD